MNHEDHKQPNGRLASEACRPRGPPCPTLGVLSPEPPQPSPHPARAPTSAQGRPLAAWPVGAVSSGLQGWQRWEGTVQLGTKPKLRVGPLLCLTVALGRCRLPTTVRLAGASFLVFVSHKSPVGSWSLHLCLRRSAATTALCPTASGVPCGRALAALHLPAGPVAVLGTEHWLCLLGPFLE